MGEKQVNTSDTDLEHLVELQDSEFDTVSAGLKARESLGAEITNLVGTILSDIGIGKPSKLAY